MRGVRLLEIHKGDVLMNLQINLEGAPREVLRTDWPESGDVYSKAGGQPGFWVVVAVTPNERQCIVLAFDMQGQVTGASRYSISYFRDNCHRRVGRTEVPSFNITWEDRP